MKRSVLLTALFLALVAVPACGGGPGVPGGPDAPGDSGGSDDPVVEIKKMSDGIQAEVEGILGVVKNADAVIDGITKLPADIKAASAKAKFDPKKLMAEAKKIVDTGDFNLDALGLEAEVKTKVEERFNKLKELVTSIKTLDEKGKALATKITDAVTKIAPLGAKAVAKIEITLKNPLAGGDAKKKAEEDKKTIEALINDWKTKPAAWSKDVTDAVQKAKDLPAKMAKAFG